MADPLIKLINSGQVTRRRYGRQVNSNVGLESSWPALWHYPARIRAITQDYTGSAAGTRVLLYAATIINALASFRADLTPYPRSVAAPLAFVARRTRRDAHF